VLVLLAGLRCEPAARRGELELRMDMVATQIEARGVQHPAVLRAMRAVPRHRFVPEELGDRAYGDFPLPIGSGQTISQPYVVAAMTELLDPEPGDRVLDVGTGSGYQAAVLAEIVEQVYSIEIVPELAQSARERLRALGYANVEVIQGDGYRGLPDRAPFDGILVAAAPGHVPPALVEQLVIGARLVIPVGKYEQELLVIERTSEGTTKRTAFPVRFVPMTGEAERARPR
jgi:protein-L-isoaspartate(D-aspartate) O-methyltransferase